MKNLIPELVEKKEPPMIIKIRKIKDKFLGTLREKPIFEIELQIASNNDEKLSSMFKKRKKKQIMNKRRYMEVLQKKVLMPI